MEKYCSFTFYSKIRNNDLQRKYPFTWWDLDLDHKLNDIFNLWIFLNMSVKFTCFSFIITLWTSRTCKDRAAMKVHWGILPELACRSDQPGHFKHWSELWNALGNKKNPDYFSENSESTLHKDCFFHLLGENKANGMKRPYITKYQIQSNTYQNLKIFCP